MWDDKPSMPDKHHIFILASDCQDFHINASFKYSLNNMNKALYLSSETALIIWTCGPRIISLILVKAIFSVAEVELGTFLGNI